MQVQMNPLSFLWWRLGKQASKPAAVIPQKPDHNLIRIFASPLSYSNSEQKSRYDSTSKAGHGEKISRCTSEHQEEKNCVLWILAKERKEERDCGNTKEEIKDAFILPFSPHTSL